MKKKIRQWLLLAVTALVLLCAAAEAGQSGSYLQYIAEPAGSTSGAAADLAALCTEWETTQRAWSLGGFIQMAAMKAEPLSASGRVTLCSENTLTLRPLTLKSGRTFTGEELTLGAPVALLDEQLAFALFRSTDVLGRTFTLEGIIFRVIGVAAHRRQIGDYADCGAYIPLHSGPVPDALLIEADPLPGAGAAASFSGVARAWRPGTFIDLQKEAMAATLWLRVGLFCLGGVAWLRFIRRMNALSQRAVCHLRRSLQQHYAAALLPGIIGRAALLILGYAAAAAAAFLLLDFILQPVYIFPEWVPPTLVEWEDVRTTFWQAQQGLAGFRELRTPELLRLRFLRGVIRIATAAAALQLSRLKKPAHP